MSKYSQKTTNERPINKATMDQPQEEFVEDEARPSHSETQAPEVAVASVPTAAAAESDRARNTQ